MFADRLLAAQAEMGMGRGFADFGQDAPATGTLGTIGLGESNRDVRYLVQAESVGWGLSLIHISEPTRPY